MIQFAVRWSTVAEWAGKTVHPEMQWEAISPPINEASGPSPYRDVPCRGCCPKDVLAALADLLAPGTAPASDCWVCIWAGFGGLEDVLGEAPLVQHLGREYFLVRAPLETIGDASLILSLFPHDGPNIWWPDDRAWCVATEVDFMWTYVGGTSAMIERLLADPRLEALETNTEHRGDYLSDTTNGPVKPY